LVSDERMPEGPQLHPSPRKSGAVLGIQGEILYVFQLPCKSCTPFPGGESGVGFGPFRQLVAGSTKAVIPLMDESANKVAEIDVGKRPRIGDVGPGVDPGPSVGLGLERDPLLHCIAQHVIDPGNLPRRRANGNHVINRGFGGADDFDFKPATGGPGFTFAPANVSVDIRKAGPKAIVAKHLPGKRRAGLGKDCVLQMLHLFFTTSYRIQTKGRGPGERHRQGETIRSKPAQSSRQLAGTDKRGTLPGAKTPTQGKLTINNTVLV